MSCEPCAPRPFCVPEDFGNLFPSLVGQPGPPGGEGLFVPNYALLRLLDGSQFPDGYTAQVGGYVTVGDGGGGAFIYEPASTAADDDGTILTPFNAIGRWRRPYTGWANVKWFGAKGDGTALGVGTDDTLKIQAAFNAICPTGKTVYFPAGIYLITATLTAPVLAGETLPRTIRAVGDGGSFQWAGAGTQIRVKASAGTFPQAMIDMTFMRFMEITGIRFVGLSKTDAGSSGIHFANQCQGAMFIECGFQNLQSAFKVGTLGELTPFNNDFCKYDKCEYYDVTYAYAMYGTEAYHHKVTRSNLINVTYVARFFQNAALTSMNSFSIKDSFIDVQDTAFHVEGNSRSIIECIGNLFEADGAVTDLPKLYVQNSGIGSFFGSAVFDRNQFNWQTFGTTTRPFMDIAGWGNVTLSNNKINVSRPIIYSYCTFAEVRPLLCINNEWSNRPVFFTDSTHTAGGAIMRINDRHDYGEALSASDETQGTNIGARTNTGLDLGWRKLAWRDTIEMENLEKGTVLLGHNPGSALEPAIEYVTDYGTNNATAPTTAATTAGSAVITVVSNAGMYLGAQIFLGDGIGLKRIKNISGTTVTLTTTVASTFAATSLTLDINIAKIAVYHSSAVIPTTFDIDGSVAFHADATDRQPSFWLKAGNWIPGGIAGGVAIAYQPPSTAADLAALIVDFNALMVKMQNAKLQNTS